MILGYKFWATFRVVVLRRGFETKQPLLSLASVVFNVNLGGGRNVLWCG